ncbi:unnamed protein product [Closterium sp. NIES-64]|nr:unnamed protein product [Closterium sp. NIES-64]
MGRSRGAGEEDHAPSGGSRPNRCRYATTNQSAAAMPPQAGRTPWGEVAAGGGGAGAGGKAQVQQQGAGGDWEEGGGAGGTGGGARKGVYHCNYCHRDVTGEVRVKCAACVDFDLCAECFSVGAAAHLPRTPTMSCLHGRILTVPNPHHQDTMSFPLVREDWTADEEMLLLEGPCGLFTLILQFKLKILVLRASARVRGLRPRASGGKSRKVVGTPPATTSEPGSPWALLSLAEGQQRCEHDETTRRDLAGGDEDGAEQSGPKDPLHPCPRSQFLRAADGQDAPETPLGRAAGEQRGERQVQLGALCEKTTPRSSGGSPSPRRPISGERAPLRTLLDALFRLDHCPPAAHVAHGHLHSSARAIAGETACAGAGGLEIGPRDEESRAAGALTAAANVQTGTDGERREEQAIGDASNRDRVNGDNVTDGLEIGSSMPRDEANVASVAMAVTVEIEAWLRAAAGGGLRVATGCARLQAVCGVGRQAAGCARLQATGG